MAQVPNESSKNPTGASSPGSNKASTVQQAFGSKQDIIKKVGFSWWFVATYLGVGQLPKAPGTWATVATLPLVWLLSQAGPIFYGLSLFIILGLGTMASQVYTSRTGQEDASQIVIDEVLGLLVTLFWVPLTWQAILLGVVLFRVLDIGKPLFIGYIDKKVHGGFGVMADDLAAGLVANMILQAVLMHTSWLGTQVV